MYWLMKSFEMLAFWSFVLSLQKIKVWMEKIIFENFNFIFQICTSLFKLFSVGRFWNKWHFINCQYNSGNKQSFSIVFLLPSMKAQLDFNKSLFLLSYCFLSPTITVGLRQDHRLCWLGFNLKSWTRICVITE
jgi:hypothetical protein